MPMLHKLRLIVVRELRLKFQSKVVIFSTLLLIAISSVAPWVSHLNGSNKNKEYHLALVDVSKSDETTLVSVINSLAKTTKMQISFQDFETSSEAMKNYIPQRLSAIISESNENFTIYEKSSSDPNLDSVLESAILQIQQLRFQIENGIDFNAFNKYLGSHAPTFTVFDQQKTSKVLISLIAVLLLYTLISLSSGFLAFTIVEEKSSKVMEVLLSSVPPKTLLTGKILGNLLYAGAQFLLFLLVGFLSSKEAGNSIFNNIQFFQIIELLFWLIPALTFFSFLYGGFGAMISRSEDVGAVQGPLGIILLAGMYLGTFGSTHPDVAWVHYFAYVPGMSFFIEPARVLAGKISMAESLSSYAVSCVFTLLVIRSCTLMFERFVLNHGNIGLSITNWKQIFSSK